MTNNYQHNMKDFGKLCGGCFEHGHSPEHEKSVRKETEVR